MHRYTKMDYVCRSVVAVRVKILMPNAHPRRADGYGVIYELSNGRNSWNFNYDCWNDISNDAVKISGVGVLATWIFLVFLLLKWRAILNATISNGARCAPYLGWFPTSRWEPICLKPILPLATH